MRDKMRNKRMQGRKPGKKGFGCTRRNKLFGKRCVAPWAGASARRDEEEAPTGAEEQEQAHRNEGQGKMVKRGKR